MNKRQTGSVVAEVIDIKDVCVKFGHIKYGLLHGLSNVHSELDF